MPRGQPDYGLYTSTPVASGISDPGEAAARLGSINIYDRRGWTIWMDDFELPLLRWEAGALVTGELPVLSVARAFSGIQSVLLNVPQGVGAQSSINRYFPLIRLGRIGVEFWVQGLTKSPGYLQLVLQVYDGATPVYADLRYDTDAGTISINTPAGLVEVATAIFMTSGSNYFLPIKLVVDMDSDMYIRLLVGEREFDVSSRQLMPLPASANRYIQPWFYVIANPGLDLHMYLDNFILTQNEP